MLLRYKVAFKFEDIPVEKVKKYLESLWNKNIVERHGVYEWEDAGYQPVETPEREIGIEELKRTIFDCFPDLWEAAEVALSVTAVLLIEDVKDPMGINFIGSPSSGKGTVLSFFYPVNPITYHTDNFTPQSFVSHYASRRREQLEEIDLLPRIKNRTIIVPELAPIFGARKDDRLKNISILTRVFDGQGLETDSAVHGRRGYSGEYMFCWLGASTPFGSAIWRLLQKLGQRWLFYNMGRRSKTENELTNEILGSNPYKEKVKKCHKAASDFLKTLWSRYGGVRRVRWQRREIEQVRIITKLANLLTRLRAYVLVSTRQSESGESVFYYTIPLIEEPERVTNLLYNLARGHALIHGRNQINDSDVSILIPIVLSSAPYERTLLITKLLDNNGSLDSSEIQDKLNCSQASASRMMKIFDILGICDKKSLAEEDEIGRPLAFIELKEEFSWFLEESFNLLRRGGQTRLDHFHTVNSVNKNIRSRSFIQKNDSVSKESSENYDFGKELEKITKLKGSD